MTTNSDIYLAAQRGLVEYRSIFLSTPTDVKPAKFHYEWSKELLHGDGHIAYEGFRESGKTSIILRTFPNYALTFPADEWAYIVFIKANQNHARKALKAISNEFLNNPAINARLLKVEKNTSDVFSVILRGDDGYERNILIEGYGKGASIRGLNNKDVRPTIIVIDDLQDKADMLGDVVPENDWDWFLSDVMFLGQSSRIFMIGNNLGERCVIERVRKRKAELGFKFQRIPCANADLTVSTWPEKQTIDEIRKERTEFEQIGELSVWLREKMCQSTSEETRIFKDSMYRYYPNSLKDQLLAGGEVLAALDPASSTRKDACLRAIVVGVIMPDGHWYLIDVCYGRWDTIKLLDEMFRVVRRWGVRDFGIEKGQLQQVLEPIIDREQVIRNVRFNIEKLEHGKIGSKLERIKAVQPYFKTGSLWFPSEASWLTELKSELAGVTRDEIKSEFIDCVDALAMLVLQMKPFSARPIRSKKYLTKDYNFEFNPMTR
jgi:predicted phage terminase large subunit-like protein